MRGLVRAELGAAAVLCAAAVAALVAAVEPGLRPPLIVVCSWASVVLVLAAARRHRPRPTGPWLAVALMLALWAAGTTLVQAHGSPTVVASVLVGAGQATAVGVTCCLWRAPAVRRRAPRPLRRAGSMVWVDLLVIAVTLGTVGAQLVAVASAGGGSSLSAVVIPTVDVVVVGLLLRVVVSRRRLLPSAHLALAGGVVTVVYDLLAAVEGQRIPLPGHPVQVLGTVSGLLFAAAALHPTMTSVFDRRTAAQQRPPSASLMGLLPLVAVPFAVWWVARLTGVPGLPTSVFLVAGAVVAGLCVVRGATALRSSEHLAEHDPLTGLANRRGLAHAYALTGTGTGPELALLLIDVDEFKAVNDSHGHDTGDALLVEVGERLRGVAGPGGTVARLGGDEFVVLVPAERADGVVADVLRVLRLPVEVLGMVLRTSASVGVAVTEGGPPLPEVLTRADVAMYAAKAAGRDTAVTYLPQMRVEVALRFTLGNEVRQLLGSSDAGAGHLEVHYQPLVDLASGEAVGAEALVRWRHHQRGLLAPDAFLGAVSASGLDAALDSAVLREVVAQLARWAGQGRAPHPVSVNLTRDSMLDPGLAPRVLSALADAGVPARLLHVEITEHQELPQDGPAAGSLLQLREAGVGVKLDDYGTGYTSLDYLRRFPVQELKLDRSVTRTSLDEGDQLVAGITAMARTMGLEVLAEGVETAEERDRLIELGVRTGQGYLFARPLGAEDYAQGWLGAPGGEPPQVSASTGGPRSVAGSVVVVAATVDVPGQRPPVCT